MKKITLFAAAMFISVATFAQVPPQGFSYQAVVRNADNQVIAEQEIQLKVTIKQGSDAIKAVPVYSETHKPTTDKNGMFTIVIGKGQGSDNFSVINWGKDNTFVKIESPFGEATEQLLSVPYALYSGNTGNVDFSNVSTENYTTLISNLSKADIATTLNLVKKDELNSELNKYAKKTDLPEE